MYMVLTPAHEELQYSEEFLLESVIDPCINLYTVHLGLSVVEDKLRYATKFPISPHSIVDTFCLLSVRWKILF